MWSIAKGILWLLDGFFEIINKIWRFDFFNNEYVNKVFTGAIIVAGSWLALKIVIELIMNYIVKNEGSGTPLNVFRGMVLAIVMMFLTPYLFNFGFDLSTKLTDDVISISALDTGASAESQISKAIVRSMIYDNEMKEEDINDLVDNWKTIDINKTFDGGLFKDYYNYSLNFFMMIVLSIVCVFLLFFVAIQMARRVMEIALYKVISPFACTSLTNNGRAFETWCKGAMGLFLVTVVQFVSIGLMLNMFGTAFQNNGTMVGLFLVIGALLFIINTPTVINSLLGQQSGIMSAFGDLQSMSALGHGISAGIGVANAGLVSAVSVAPKSLGYASGLKQQFNTHRENGSSTLGSIGKVALSEIGRPFVSAYQKTTESFKNNYSNSKLNASNPFGLDTSNPFMNPHSMKYNPIRNQYNIEPSIEFNNSGDDKS